MSILVRLRSSSARLSPVIVRPVLISLLSTSLVLMSLVPARTAGAGTGSDAPPSTPVPTPGGGPGPDQPADPGPNPGADPGPDPGPGPDPDSTTTVDPLIDEGPGETAPPVEATVPPRDGGYGGQGSPEPAEVLWSSVRKAEDKVADARWMHEELIGQARTARAGLKALIQRQQGLDAQSRQATDELRAAEALVQERAVAAFVSNDRATNEVIGSLQAADHDQVLDLQIRQRLLGVALDADEAAIADYIDRRAGLARELLDIVDQIRNAETSVMAAEGAAEAAAEALRQAEVELAAFAAGSAIYISGVVFPVAQPYNRPLIDSFGFPRMPGTPDEHWHEGIDIFAPAGTPLLAAERGVITRVGSNRLGGLTVWLRGESGSDWYYAHLQAHADGLAPGDVVEAGTVVGYVGNTGNAISTPPHLHLQLHPGGGDPVNPYPLLKVVSDQDGAEGSR